MNLIEENIEKLFTEEKLNEIVNMPSNDLCHIMNKYLSDKGNGHHNYTKLYHTLFSDIRDKPLSFLEIGIGSIDPRFVSNMSGIYGYKPGGSLKGWKEYFFNSMIYGCDIDIKALFQEDRIKTFFLDQTNLEIINNIFNETMFKDKSFDLIVDDGLHEFFHNMNTMYKLIHKLNPYGYYIIEDILDYNPYLINEKALKGCKWQYISLPNERNNVDNNLFIIQKLE